MIILFVNLWTYTYENDRHYNVNGTQICDAIMTGGGGCCNFEFNKRNLCNWI